MKKLFRYDMRFLIVNELVEISKSTLFRKPQSDTIHQLTKEICYKLYNKSYKISKRVVYMLLDDLKDRGIMVENGDCYYSTNGKTVKTYRLDKKKLYDEFCNEFKETQMYQFIDGKIYTLIR